MMTNDIPRDHLLSNRVYDVLNFIALVFLPALGTLYFTLAGIWGLPAAEQVVGTIVAVDAFLGVFLKVGTNSYNNSEAKYDGSIDVLPNKAGGQTYSLNLNGDPAYLHKVDQVSFKVNPPE